MLKRRDTNKLYMKPERGGRENILKRVEHGGERKRERERERMKGI